MGMGRQNGFAMPVMQADAALVRTEAEGALRCVACGHRCVIAEGRSGRCKMRSNRGGVLYVPGGYVAGLQADPIEKKPFYHVFPGQQALSFGMLGCNLHCAYCQNWQSSQVLRDDEATAHYQECSEAQIVTLAAQVRAPILVSTYNEPLITADWAVRVFRLAGEQGIVCGFVSNGNASPEVMEYLRPHMRLFKIDLKSFDDTHYRGLGCPLQNVLDTITRAKGLDYWVEIVTLLVPGFNDSVDELRRMADFLAGISPEIPWHVTAFHPDYQMLEPRATQPEDLLRAYEIGRAAGLHFVYAGNLPGRVQQTENTYCPGCNALLIERRGFRMLNNQLADSACPECGQAIPGVWS